MGIQKQNVPTRFDEETLGLIDWDRAQHKMTRSQYVRESMIKWLRLRMAGTVQLLDAFAQQEQRNNCLPREQREQSLQIEFPSAVESPETLLGPKPLTRIVAPPSKGVRGRAIRSVSQRRAVGAGVRLAYMPHFPGKVSPIKSNSYVSARVA